MMPKLRWGLEASGMSNAEAKLGLRGICVSNVEGIEDTWMGNAKGVGSTWCGQCQSQVGAWRGFGWAMPSLVLEASGCVMLRGWESPG